MPLLQINDLKVYYTGHSLFRKQTVTKAVDGVSLFIDEHETLGLVGESGSGKSTLGKASLLLVKPAGGRIIFDGTDMVDADTYKNKAIMKKFRQEAQIVFQDPYSSLNPRMKVGRIITDPLRVHGFKDRKLLKERAMELLKLVGLSESAYDKYPYAFSGGQRQRISIARALAINPRFIVADEPVSSLDISIQAQLLNLFKQIQEEKGISYLFISHDLRTVAFIAHRIAVMYLGRIMELASKQELIIKPLHPYTRLLLSSIPSKDRKSTEHNEPLNKSGMGCAFYPRCSLAKGICMDISPKLKEVSPGHAVACHLY
jgi:oligopeptide/dipeptide ABC transporter ATP-binding protein